MFHFLFNHTSRRFSTSMSRAAHRLPLFCFLAALLCLTGCSGGKKGKNQVNGTVTFEGKDVAGDVVFISEDGKETPSPIFDGKYKILNAPLGKNKIIVKPGLGMGPGGLKEPPKDFNKDSSAMKKAGGVPPPAKYLKPDNGLEIDVKEGEQEFNIELKK